MKQDYLVYPSMVGAQAGVIWSYDNSSVISSFDDTHPLNVTVKQCDNLSICLWYVSPLIQFNDSTKYAFLGEWNKWTAVSRQRIIGIDNEININLALLNIQGVPSETTSFVVYHSTLQSVTVRCRMSPDSGQARIVVSSSKVGCY